MADELQTVVKYKNVINEMNFRSFTENDFNLFMCLCARLKNLGEETQVIDYDYLMDIINWDKTQKIDLFQKELRGMVDRLRNVGATIDIDPDKFTAFNLFEEFEGDKKKRTLTVSVNKRFKNILNEFTDGLYTKFELAEYVRLDGKYTKLIYQHLKQYKYTGWWKITIEEARRELAIPDSYKNTHIMSKVIKPSLEIIRSCKGFSDITVETLQSNRRGRAATGYIFRWTPDRQIPGQYTMFDYEPIEAEDVEQKPEELEAEKSKPRKSGRNPKNRFNNFHQRDYNFDAMESKLLTLQNKALDTEEGGGSE